MAEKSLKSSAKKIAYLSILLAIKETWLLLTNIIGLIYHPFLTLRKIRKKHDLSQVALVFLTIAFPLLTAVFTTGLIYLAMTIFGFSFPNAFKQFILVFDLLTVFLTSFILIYLIFWTFQVLRKNHYSLFVEKK